MKNSRNTPLEHGGYYHIYNRGNNGETLFYKFDNYYHFLRLYEKYIDPIAETYAWCLMGNHFHLLVRIKDETEIGFLDYFDSSRSDDSRRSKWRFSNNPPESARPGGVMGKQPVPHRMFGHLFNAYTKYINLTIGRTGSLFEKNFHRIPITSNKYFQNLVVYIHHNPVHHGFTDDFKDYPWSSYGSVVSEKPTHLMRSKVLDWFDDRRNFIYAHSLQNDFDSISHLTID